MVAVGLATHFVPSEKLNELEKCLLSLNSGDENAFRNAIEEFSIDVLPEEETILNRLQTINKCFCKESLEEIMESFTTKHRHGHGDTDTTRHGHDDMRRLEGQNIPSHQAEVIVYTITEVTDDVLQHSSTLFATKEQLKMSEMIQDDNHFKFIYEIRSLKEDHFLLLLCEIKELKVDIKKIKTELSYEIREATMRQRLELRREREYFHDELSKQFSEIHKNFKEKRLAQIIPSGEAKDVASAVTEAAKDALQHASFVTEKMLKSIKMIEDDKLNEFKSEMNVLQEQHVSLMQRKLEEIKAEIKEINNDFMCSK